MTVTAYKRGSGLLGLGCDCYSQDSGGNCLDPTPCAGDTSPRFDPVTGYPIYVNDSTNTTNVTATTAQVSTTTTTCTESYVSGVCDYFVYGALAIGAFWLMNQSKGRR